MEKIGWGRLQLAPPGGLQRVRGPVCTVVQPCLLCCTHRLQPDAYAADCQELRTQSGAHSSVLHVSPQQAFAFSDGSDAAGEACVGCLLPGGWLKVLCCSQQGRHRADSCFQFETMPHVLTGLLHPSNTHLSVVKGSGVTAGMECVLCMFCISSP